MTLIDFVFPKLRTLKTWLDKCLEKSRFRRHFDKQHGKQGQILVKSTSQHLYHIYWSLSRKLSSKKSRLLTCQTLGLLVNTLAPDGKYPVLNKENLTIPIQMQLSRKTKIFSEFFAAFFKFRVNFEHFEKKDDRHGFCISDIMRSNMVIIAFIYFVLF